MTVLLGDYPIVFLLVLFRVAGMLFALPLFGIMRENGWLLAGASFPTALFFCTLLPPEFREAADALRVPGDILLALVGELFLGGAMGAIFSVFTGVFFTAGSIAEKGASLGMAEELDPMSGESAGVLSQVLRMLFLVLLFAANAHLPLIRLVVESFRAIPAPWMGWMTCGLDMARLGGVCFELGLSLALPILVATLLVTVAMALLARFAQEFNVLFLSMSFRIAIGLLVFGMSVLIGEEPFMAVARKMLTTLSRFIAA
jgi:flagellar biosynthesis protein FliR